MSDPTGKTVRRSLVLRALLATSLLTVTAVCLPLLLLNWVTAAWAAILSLLVMLPAAFLTVRALWEPMLAIFHALSGTVTGTTKYATWSTPITNWATCCARSG